MMIERKLEKMKKCNQFIVNTRITGKKHTECSRGWVGVGVCPSIAL